MCLHLMTRTLLYTLPTVSKVFVTRARTHITHTILTTQHKHTHMHHEYVHLRPLYWRDHHGVSLGNHNICSHVSACVSACVITRLVRLGRRRCCVHPVDGAHRPAREHTIHRYNTFAGWMARQAICACVTRTSVAHGAGAADRCTIRRAHI